LAIRRGAHYETNVGFASSYIGTNGSIELPSSPRFDQTALRSGGDSHWLWTFTDGSDAVGIRHDGTSVNVEGVVVGVVKAASRALPNHAWRAVALDPPAEIVNIANALSGNGDGATETAWTFPARVGRVGGIYGAANEAFGRTERTTA